MLVLRSSLSWSLSSHSCIFYCCYKKQPGMSGTVSAKYVGDSKPVLCGKVELYSCETSQWQEDPFLKSSAAASLSGNLLAVGGYNLSTPASSAVYIFLPLTNSWVRVTTGDLPEPHYTTALQYSSHPTKCWWLVGGIARRTIPKLYTWGLSQSRTDLLLLCCLTKATQVGLATMLSLSSVLKCLNYTSL